MTFIEFDEKVNDTDLYEITSVYNDAYQYNMMWC